MQPGSTYIPEVVTYGESAVLFYGGRIERVGFGEALWMIVQLRAGCAMDVLGIAGELMQKLLLRVRQVDAVLVQCAENALREK